MRKNRRNRKVPCQANAAHRPSGHQEWSEKELEQAVGGMLGSLTYDNFGRRLIFNPSSSSSTSSGSGAPNSLAAAGGVCSHGRPSPSGRSGACS
jgi:hypothetical protein